LPPPRFELGTSRLLSARSDQLSYGGMLSGLPSMYQNQSFFLRLTHRKGKRERRLSVVPSSEHVRCVESTFLCSTHTAARCVCRAYTYQSSSHLSRSVSAAGIAVCVCRRARTPLGPVAPCTQPAARSTRESERGGQTVLS